MALIPTAKRGLTRQLYVETCRRADLRKLDALIKEGARVEGRVSFSFFRHSSIFKAADIDYTDALMLFYQQNMRIEPAWRSMIWDQAFAIAVPRGNIKSVEFLLKLGVDARKEILQPGINLIYRPAAEVAQYMGHHLLAELLRGVASAPVKGARAG